MKRRDRVYDEDEEARRRDLSLWVPRTQIGQKVKSGEIAVSYTHLTLPTIYSV